jgi:hypothetical protein
MGLGIRDAEPDWHLIQEWRIAALHALRFEVVADRED